MSSIQQILPPPHPGFRASAFLPTADASSSNTTAVTTLDTVIYLYPYRLALPITVVSLSVRVSTGAAGSAVKMGVWNNDRTLGRPTGLAITGLVSNTGQATTGNNTNAQITGLSKTLPPDWYWFGSAFTTLGPQCMSVSGSGGVYQLNELLMRSALATNVVAGLSAPYTYATDITTLDLTGASFTDVSGAAGIPVIYLGT